MKLGIAASPLVPVAPLPQPGPAYPLPTSMAMAPRSILEYGTYVNLASSPALPARLVADVARRLPEAQAPLADS